MSSETTITGNERVQSVPAIELTNSANGRVSGKGWKMQKSATR